jgi:hypothetical protein
MTGILRLEALAREVGLLSMPTLRVWYQVGMMKEIPRPGWLLSVSNHIFKRENRADLSSLPSAQRILE